MPRRTQSSRVSPKSKSSFEAHCEDKEVEFDATTVGAEASTTHAVDAGKVKVGGYVVLSERPCRVVALRRAANGKHGPAVIHMEGLDVFTGRKYEGMQKAKHAVQVPDMRKVEFEVVDCDDEGFMTLQHPETGDLRADLRLPEDCDVDAEAVRRIAEGSDEHAASVSVVVLSAMGIEAVDSVRVMRK